MTDGGTDVLRVNAAGILAKTGHLDQLDAVDLRLRHDGGARGRYVDALGARVGRAASRIAGTLSGAVPIDSPSTWMRRVRNWAGSNSIGSIRSASATARMVDSRSTWQARVQVGTAIPPCGPAARPAPPESSPCGAGEKAIR